ncbi:MAG: hypothetical protein JST11_02590 [Acidobacteria bacterium]|nr:hypothetical protein [Acidobacteriota bacterium]
MRTAFLLAVVLAAPLCAQPQRDVFKVDFTIRDSGDAGGKAGRKYSMLVYGGNKGIFKIGNRVPVTTGGGGVGQSTQFTYVDVGVNIECTVQETANGKIGLRGDIDLSTSVAQEKPAPAPTISQIRLSFETAIPPGKATSVASFDDPVTSRKFDVEAVAAKVN